MPHAHAGQSAAASASKHRYHAQFIYNVIMVHFMKQTGQKLKSSFIYRVEFYGQLWETSKLIYKSYKKKLAPSLNIHPITTHATA